MVELGPFYFILYYYYFIGSSSFCLVPKRLVFSFLFFSFPAISQEPNNESWLGCICFGLLLIWGQ
jgi:hypothetical protein